MRISDWSSDVCSSDLELVAGARPQNPAAQRLRLHRRPGSLLTARYATFCAARRWSRVRRSVRPYPQQNQGEASMIKPLNNAVIVLGFGSSQRVDGGLAPGGIGDVAAVRRAVKEALTTGLEELFFVQPRQE